MGHTDCLDRDESERDFMKRLLSAFIQYLERIQRAAGRPIKLNTPIDQQFDAETSAAIYEVLKEEDEELEALFAALDRYEDEELESQ
jgi:hypothetical protein